jgi:hypothetical protein
LPATVGHFKLILGPPGAGVPESRIEIFKAQVQASQELILPGTSGSRFEKRPATRIAKRYHLSSLSVPTMGSAA